MGTRADFYVGRGSTAEWLGSIAYDGYPSGIKRDLLKATTEKQFRAEVAKFLANDEDRTLPEEGWPWPWDDSGTTDYAYAFDGNRVYASCFGSEWFDPINEPDLDLATKTKVDFPDMSARRNLKRPGEPDLGGFEAAIDDDLCGTGPVKK